MQNVFLPTWHSSPLLPKLKKKTWEEKLLTASQKHPYLDKETITSKPCFSWWQCILIIEYSPRWKQIISWLLTIHTQTYKPWKCLPVPDVLASNWNFLMLKLVHIRFLSSDFSTLSIYFLCSILVVKLEREIIL